MADRETSRRQIDGRHPSSLVDALADPTDVQSQDFQSDKTIQNPQENVRPTLGEQQFSVAGHPGRAQPQGGGYVHPDYVHYNPQYGQESNAPVWSLAQPLPRVVRRGMTNGQPSNPESKPDYNTDTDTEEKTKGTQDSPNAHKDQIPASEEPPTQNPIRSDKHKPRNEDPEAKVARPDDEGFFNRWGRIRFVIREPLAEWLGTTIAMTLGLCAGFSTYASQNQAGSFASLAPAWGFAFMIAIYMAGGISGGHLNPAITISMSVWRGFPAKKCVVYVLAQIVGAITAGGLAYALYHDTIVNTAAVKGVSQADSPARQAMITTPKDFVHPVTAFFNEFVGTAVLVATIMALGDDTNAPPGAGMQAFIVGIVISVLVLSLGYNTGGCFNGARDFGPRLVAVMAGWGGHLFREQHAWWIWGPWAADIAGGLCGGFLYDLVIFTGGESPINYPRRRRKRAWLIKQKNLRSRLHLGRRKIGDIERAVHEVEQ
ncbi:putative aquaglyceroporin [Aspergillus clavatus NRRL 1]|uniref:MIP transporter, putative n=1 Tax=Aspergillus clavatus (strain ATCC 1007 / CBS 513.65 / DSM 816 / NCTC 3887 / NRRL 1 / QM 1276 / 107) TaxID=344612 RepID=A1CLV9_ASPCL|nr:MIP transporter, putative [Aspergillus clavatus NRRL 1]EAW09088.1 MIP transporter, putative [Aspergillus clavatus NRRL 1]